MSTNDKRIREFAYQIWESEGKPEGQDARHWEMARKLAEAEALAPSKSPKAAGSKAAGPRPRPAKPMARQRSQKPKPSPPLPPRSSRRAKKPTRKSLEQRVNRPLSDASHLCPD